MAEYLHGAYGQVNTSGAGESEVSLGAFVYIGTAPVHTVEGGAANVNKPILVRNIAEARKYFGYSSDWAKYTLCEAMHVHLEQKGVGPIVLINVLDPATHKASTKTTTTITPVNGVLTMIAGAEDAILDTIVIKTTGADPTTKVKGTDYEIAYDYTKKQVIARELTAGALGTAALTVEYFAINAAAVDATTVIGSSDGMGLNTGVYAIKDVYQRTGYIPAFMLAPGFSSIPNVHNVMAANSIKVNGHWNIYMYTDIPILNGATAITLDTAYTFKKANGYTCDNETTFFPLVEGTDGNKYHISVLAAANLQELLLDQDGIPYRTASNTECAIIKNIYLGEDYVGRVYDDEIINKKLNENGIASAAFVGGRWVIWGAHSASYDQDNASYTNVSETSHMMLNYICNDFQERRTIDVDKPLTANDLRTIVSEEQARLDALVNIGALTYGVVRINAELMDTADIANGDYVFSFDVTTTPLAKSLTAVVNWTDDGFVTFFEGAE